MENIDTKLKWIRTMRGMSQSQLARAAGVSVRAIQNYEQRQRRIDLATGTMLYRLATALDVTMEQLLEHDKD